MKASKEEKPISYKEFQRTIARKQFSPVYFIYGEETFLLEEALRTLVVVALDPTLQQFNLDVFHGDEGDIQEILSRASSFPMMGERRIVIVKGIEKMKSLEKHESKELALLVNYLKRPSPTTCFVLTTQRPDFRKHLYETLQSSALLVECKPLSDHQLTEWIEEQALSKGKKITSGAIQRIQTYVGNSLLEIHNELEKLFIFVGEKREISEGDVDEVIGVSKQYSIFELTRALGERESGRAMEIAECMLQRGQSPSMMIPMITRHFDILWKLHDLRRRKVAESEMASLLRLHPYYLKTEYLPQINNYSEPQIEQCFAALVEADERLKSTGDDPKLVMTLLMYHLVK